MTFKSRVFSGVLFFCVLLVLGCGNGSDSSPADSLPIEGIEILPGDIEIVQGAGVSLSVITLDEDFENQIITWNSSNPAVLSVTQEGRISAISNGSVSVNAAVSGNPLVSDSILVTVTDSVTLQNIPQDVSIQISSISPEFGLIDLDQAMTFTGSGEPPFILLPNTGGLGIVLPENDVSELQTSSLLPFQVTSPLRSFRNLLGNLCVSSADDILFLLSYLCTDDIQGACDALADQGHQVLDASLASSAFVIGSGIDPSLVQAILQAQGAGIISCFKPSDIVISPNLVETFPGDEPIFSVMGTLTHTIQLSSTHGVHWRVFDTEMVTGNLVFEVANGNIAAQTGALASFQLFRQEFGLNPGVYEIEAFVPLTFSPGVVAEMDFNYGIIATASIIIDSGSFLPSED